MTTLVTLATEEMRDVWQLFAKTWNAFCARHGYYLKCYTSAPYPELAPSWNKIPILLNQAKYATGPVWWIDADMLVLDMHPPLPIPTKPVWISTDWNGICCGLMGCSNNEWAFKCLEAAFFCGDVLDPDEFGKDCGVKWEQNAFKALMKSFPAVKDGIMQLPENLVSDKPPFKSQIAHLGGRTNKERIRLGHELMSRMKV